MQKNYVDFVQIGVLANETFKKPSKHFQTLYLVSIDFDLPFTVLKLLYYKQCYKNFKEKAVQIGPIISAI